MSDIKELLEIYVATANSGKYKTFDEVNSKFPELKDYDKAILEEYVATANSGKYKTFDEVNSKFPEFFGVGVKKKAESDSSLDISAGPYASGQKPKGFGDIVSEKISEVSPQEEKQIKIKQEKAPQQSKQVQKTTTDSYGQQAMDALGSGIISTIDALALGGLHAIDIILPTGSEIGENETINKAISKVKEANVSATQESKDREALLPFNGSPSDAFMAGEWGTVAKLTGLKVLNSVPTSVAMGSNPAVAASWAIGNVSNEYSKLKKEGYSDTQAAVDASINTSSEILVDKLFGGAKQIKTLFAQGGKEAVKSAIKKKLALELGKTAVENIGGEQLENLTSNLSKKYVLGKKDQDLFEGAGDTFFTSFGTSALYSPLTIINTAKNNLIAKEQAKEGTPTISDPNQPELPPDAGGSVPKLDLQNLGPDTTGSIRWDKSDLEDDLRFNERLASVTKPKNILDKALVGAEKILGISDPHKKYVNKVEDTKRKLDLLENNPIAFYEEKIADYNKQLEASKDDEETKEIKGHIERYKGVVEDLKDQEQVVLLSDDINSQFGESSDFISGLIDELTEATESEHPSQRNADQYLALLKYNPKKYLKNRIDYYTRLDNKSGDNYWSETIIPKFQKALDDLEKNKLSFDDVMSYSQNQGDSPNADADNIDLTQLVKAKEVVQKIIDNDGVATSIDGTPVDIQELNEQGEVVLQDGNIVSMSDITVHSELGDNPLVDVVNAELENEQQVPDSQPEQQQAQTTELPKKIFHATKASFEGLPSRQEQSKVSAFGTEPAGTFYSTNPDRAKQAIGDGGDARVIEADFNPKNPLVIENTDNEVYVNTKNESEQQAIEELNDEYIESGVDLTTLEEGELPEKVNKRTTEIFADKLREQGYDAVINNENGDIIVLDDAIVTEKKAEPKAEVTDSKDEVEYESYYDNLELSDRGKELQKQIDSIDDIIENKDKPLSNIQKFRLKDISPILLKGDIYGLVNLALLNIKTPVLLRDSVLNNGTQVKGIGVNKKDTWINTSTDANKAMSMDDLIHRVTEFVTQHIGEISQTDESGNVSVAQLISNADIPNIVYDVITGSKESAYETLKQFADQEVDINSLMEERSNLQKELDEDQIQYEILVSQESDKIDLREIQKNFELLFEVGGASKKKNLTSDPKIMEIYNNFDNIIEQLGYKKTKDADC